MRPNFNQEEIQSVSGLSSGLGTSKYKGILSILDMLEEDQEEQKDYKEKRELSKHVVDQIRKCFRDIKHSQDAAYDPAVGTKSVIIRSFLPKFITESKTLKQVFYEFKIFDNSKQPLVMVQNLASCSPDKKYLRQKKFDGIEEILILMMQDKLYKLNADQVWQTSIYVKYLLAANRLLDLPVPTSAKEFFDQEVETEAEIDLMCELLKPAQSYFAKVVGFYLSCLRTLTRKTTLTVEETNACLFLIYGIAKFCNYIFPLQTWIVKHPQVYQGVYIGAPTMDTVNTKTSEYMDHYVNPADDLLFAQLTYLKLYDRNMDVDETCMWAMSNRVRGIFSSALKFANSQPARSHVKYKFVAQSLLDTTVKYCEALENASEALKVRAATFLTNVQNTVQDYDRLHAECAGKVELDFINDHVKGFKIHSDQVTTYHEAEADLQKSIAERRYQNDDENSVQNCLNRVQAAEQAIFTIMECVEESARLLMLDLRSAHSEIPESDESKIRRLDQQLLEIRAQLQEQQELNSKLSDKKIVPEQDLMDQVDDNAKLVTFYRKENERLQLEHTIATGRLATIQTDRPDFLRRCIGGKNFSMTDVIKTIQHLYPTVRMLDTIEEMVGYSTYKHPENLLKYLHLLCGDYRDSILAGNSDSVSRKILGNNYKACESECTMRDRTTRRYRMFLIEGVEHECQQHFTIGSKHNDQDTIQIYFKFVDQVLWIVYIGSHLPIKSSD